MNARKVYSLANLHPRLSSRIGLLLLLLLSYCQFSLCMVIMIVIDQIEKKITIIKK